MTGWRTPGLYIPAPTPETGHVFAHFHSQKPARFPAEQKERSCIETLLFPVSRGCRYNTLYFASKVVCQGDAVPIGFPRQQGCFAPLLDDPAPKEESPSFGNHPKSKTECACQLRAFRFAFAEKRQRICPDSLPFFKLIGRDFLFC